MKIPAPVATAFSSLLRLPPPPEPPPGDESTAMVFRASGKFLPYRMTSWGLAAGVALAAAATPLVFSWALNFPKPSDAAILRALGLVLTCGVALVLGLTWALIRLDYAWRWYVVTDRSLRIREGVWRVREMTVTFANVQNLSIEQGPLQRLFGLSDLRVDTAGGGGSAGPGHAAGRGNMHTAWLRGLDTAADVRALIQARLRGRPDAGLGDPDEPASASHHDTGQFSQDVVWGVAEILEETRALRASAHRLAAVAGPPPLPPA